MHPLDNVVWNALTTRQAMLAEGGALARRMAPAFGPFNALREPSDEAFRALAALLPEGETAGLVTAYALSPTPEFEVVQRAELVQMVGSRLDIGVAESSASSAVHKHRHTVVALGPEDVPAMRALVEQTKPGPFGDRTHALGDFVGVRIDGRLAAMAGERLHLDGFREVSAVCTDPDFRGRGLARTLILTVCRAIVSRSETPFLHAFVDNTPAIRVYERLGFTHRTTMRLLVLRRR